jgi:hypothetical protein
LRRRFRRRFRAIAGSLYQKWKKENGEGMCSAFPDPSYFEVTPVVPAPPPVGQPEPTFFARKIPKCKDGTETCAGYEVRSLDGTRAFYYVDPGNVGVETQNKWIIAFEGGGACAAETLRHGDRHRNHGP